LHQRVAVPLIELEILIANTQRRIARARCHREVRARSSAWLWRTGSPLQTRRRTEQPHRQDGAG
jgi:hypothetical protein